MNHFTIVGIGEALEHNVDLNLQPGRVALQMKAWTTDEEAALDMFVAVCNDIQFKLDGDVDVIVSHPVKPEGDVPFAYDIGWDPIG